MSDTNLITQKNKYDKTGDCIQSGLGAEQVFEQIALSKSLEVLTSSINHIRQTRKSMVILAVF